MRVRSVSVLLTRTRLSLYSVTLYRLLSHSPSLNCCRLPRLVSWPGPTGQSV